MFDLDDILCFEPSKREERLKVSVWLLCLSVRMCVCAHVCVFAAVCIGVHACYQIQHTNFKVKSHLLICLSSIAWQLYYENA